MFHLPYRKSRQFTTPTREGLRRSSRFWMLRRRCMEHSGPMLEQHWLWCGSKGLTSGSVWVGSEHESVPIVTLHVLCLIQGSTIYPSVPPEPCGRREGWQQSQPDSGQCYQRLWSSPEKVSRLVGAAALQGEFRVLPSVFRWILESLNFDLLPSQAALFAAPYKSDFLRALSKGRDVKEEECMEKIRKFLVNFTATVDAIYEMYNKMNADLDYKVWLFLPSSDPPSSRPSLVLNLWLCTSWCCSFQVNRWHLTVECIYKGCYTSNSCLLDHACAFSVFFFFLKAALINSSLLSLCVRYYYRF